MESCKHKKTHRIPYFPGDRLACKQCGELMPPLGYVDGIRDYYVPDDPPWCRQVQITKLKWLAGLSDDLEQCPRCCFVGTIDDFDVMGAEDGHWFCNQCGHEFDSCPSDSRKQLELFE